MFVFIPLILLFTNPRLINWAAAQPTEETPFQQMLQNETHLNSHESTVDISGAKYQKIEIKNESYYVVFKGRKGDIPYLLCARPAGFQSEHLIEGTAKIMQRKAIFFKTLKESCVVQNGQQKESVILDPVLGFQIPETSKDRIKNKKIGINPLNPSGLDFSGEF